MDKKEIKNQNWIQVHVNDAINPDINKSSNTIIFNIETEELEHFLKLCKQSRLCAIVLYDFTMDMED